MAPLPLPKLLSSLADRGSSFWLYSPSAPGWRQGGTRGSAGPGLVFLALLAIGAVFATGGHSRYRALNQPIRLFFAVAGAVLVTWAGGIARGFLPDLVLPMVATAGTMWITLLLVRQVSEGILRDVWPRQRGAATAILVGSPEG